VGSNADELREPNLSCIVTDVVEVGPPNLLQIWRYTWHSEPHSWRWPSSSSEPASAPRLSKFSPTSG